MKVRTSSCLLTAGLALALSACSSEQPAPAETDAADTSGDVIVEDERVAPVTPSATAEPMTTGSPTATPTSTASPGMPTGTPTPESTGTASPTPMR